MFGLEKEAIAKATPKAQSQDMNPFKFNIPDRFIRFYHKCADWLKDKPDKRDERFIYELLQVDKAWNSKGGHEGEVTGFLTNQQIHECFNRSGMKLKPK